MDLSSIAVGVLVVAGLVGAFAATVAVSARGGRRPGDGKKRGAR